MEQYANRLKGLSTDCGYKGEHLERQLRDRFATGLSHIELETYLKQKWPDLLRETEKGVTREVTFAEIFAIAQSRENAEYDTPNTPLNVNKIKQPNIKKPKPNEHKLARKLYTHQCLRCGNSEKHALTRCLAKTHICAECTTKGHFENCCIKSGRAYITQSNHQRINTKNKLQRISDIPSTSQDSVDSSDEEDFVCKIGHTHNKGCKQIDINKAN